MKKKLCGIVLSLILMSGCSSEAKNEQMVDMPLFSTFSLTMEITSMEVHDGKCDVVISIEPTELIQKLMDRNYIDGRYELPYKVKYRCKDGDVEVEGTELFKCDLKNSSQPVKMTLTLPENVNEDEIGTVSIFVMDNRDETYAGHYEVAYCIRDMWIDE